MFMVIHFLGNNFPLIPHIYSQVALTGLLHTHQTENILNNYVYGQFSPHCFKISAEDWKHINENFFPNN
jgi:hypothetical protein